MLSARLGRTVTAGEPYAQVFPTGRFRNPRGRLRQSTCWLRFPSPTRATALFATAAEAETLQDDKGALRADWTHGNGTLTGYYFLDNYSLDNPYPTGTGGASVPGFDATCNGRAQLASLATRITFGAAALNEFHLSYMRNAQRRGPAQGRRGAVARVAGIHRASLRSSLRPKALRISPSTTSPWAWTPPPWCRPRTSTR